MDPAIIEADLRRGIGRRKVTQDFISPALVDRLSKTLECDDDPPASGEALPAGWHTIFCLHAAARGELGADGLPLTYDLIPQVPMQRRLFGGARLEFHAPLIVGEKVTCDSELSDVKLRSTSDGTNGCRHTASSFLRCRGSLGGGRAGHHSSAAARWRRAK